MEILGFFSNVRESFRKMREDVVDLRNSINEWVVFLNSNQREMKRKIYELDKRMRQLEMERVAEIVKVK